MKTYENVEEMIAPVFPWFLFLPNIAQDMVSACGPEFNLNAGCSLDVTGLLTKLGCIGCA